MGNAALKHNYAMFYYALVNISLAGAHEPQVHPACNGAMLLVGSEALWRVEDCWGRHR